MKAIEILKAITENEGTHLWLDDGSGYPKSYIYEAIKELEEFQENKLLVKMNEEMIELRKENQDLLNSNNELLEGLISTQKKLKEWLERCN